MGRPYRRCELCPRACRANREAGERGFCGEGAALRLASASLHRGEEPPVTGEGGSGTIFVTGCSLGCVFCQNRQISRERMGRAVGTDEFAGICLALQHAGAENINLVTGTHAAPALRLGVERARARGLRIPVCWNSSAYEAPASLAEAEAFADWYLPDLKTLDPRIAGRLFGAPDYPQAARDAVLRMTQARPGRVIVRHLILPGLLDSTREVLRWFAERLAGRALLSLMTQYTPVSGIDAGAPPRPLSPAEYDQALTWLSEFGIEEGFCQERPSGAPDRDWLPDFSRPNPFPSSLSTPVWHWGQ